MNIEILLEHEHIAIDFDGTLVDGPNSPLLQQFIVRHPEKYFYIVTFRSHGLQDHIEVELLHSAEITEIEINIDHFHSIHNIPNRLYERKIFLLKNDDYYAWKAKKCKELGCTVLVDDMAEPLRKHCEELGILIINPEDFD